MPTIKLIAMDVDGTLYNSRGQISKENIAAMRAAQEKGVVVAIATGRTPANMMVATREAGLLCPVIGTNGTHVVDENNRILFQHFMDPAAAVEAQERLSKLDTEYNVVTSDALCMSKQDTTYPMEKSFYDQLAAFGQECLFGPENARECARRRVHKMFAYNCADIQAVRDALRDIPGIYLSQSGSGNVEVMPVGADKILGVEALARHYGIAMKDVMTLGDEMNDYGMISGAGWGIAMGNAIPAIKQIARYVTQTCDQHGVAAAIWRYAL